MFVVNYSTMILFLRFNLTHFGILKTLRFERPHLSFASRGDTKVPNSRISRKRRPGKIWESWGITKEIYGSQTRFFSSVK